MSSLVQRCGGTLIIGGVDHQWERGVAGVAEVNAEMIQALEPSLLAQYILPDASRNLPHVLQ